MPGKIEKEVFTTEVVLSVSCKPVYVREGQSINQSNFIYVSLVHIHNQPSKAYETQRLYIKMVGIVLLVERYTI